MIIREMILFSLLCLGALFFNSSEFVGTEIVPKWYMTITMGILLVVYYLILSQRKRPFSFEMQGIIYYYFMCFAGIIWNPTILGSVTMYFIF